MHMATTDNGRLTKREKQRYLQKGLVVPEFRLPASTLQALREALDKIIQKNPDLRGERLIGAHIEQPNSSGLRGDKVFLDVAHNEKILGLVESAIGPDIILWSTHIFCKPAGDGHEVPWHQDGHFWPIRPLATCSVWIALDEVTMENGAMGYIPGSHTDQVLYSHHTDSSKSLALNQVLDGEFYDPKDAEYNILEAGQLSLHDVHLIHGSPSNQSDKRRAGLVLRYMPATSLFDRRIVQEKIVVDFSNMPIWLVRGKDRHGQNDFSVGRLP
jgi:hypothetical protein